MQVAYVAACKGDIGDVGYPQLVGCGQHDALDQVLVHAVAMV